MDLQIHPKVHWSRVEGRPIIVAGPCAAESEEQVLETARRLSGTRVDFFRAGIWKARTRPGSFEGIGAPALAWLRAAGERYGMRTATEVAQPSHVEAALAAGIDLLWIGARTTVNPFSVQELANALRGTSVPVLVKNPTSPDLQLWIGAFERLAQAGVRSLGAIHRGVSVANSKPYRNAPMWSFPIELRRLVPELPIVNDPSHICGRRDLLQAIAQRAMDLGLDGLMLETHPNPDQAWSDASQQVTPERASEIFAELVVRRPDVPSDSFHASLESLRARIDQVDHDLVHLLADRMSIVMLIAELKRTNNVTTLQVARWRALLEDRMERARELGLDSGYIKALYDVIHGESVRRQSAVISNGRVGALQEGDAERWSTPSAS
jgi:chorismate mutase